MYDITSRPSFENVEGWLSELRQYSEGNVVIVLVIAVPMRSHTDWKQVRFESSALRFNGGGNRLCREAQPGFHGDKCL